MKTFKLIAFIFLGFFNFSQGFLLSDHEFISQLNCTSGLSVCSDLSQCIPSTYLCDGRIDCEDGSDEKWTLCYYRNFDCGDSRNLIRASLKCDGKKDCPDGSDEEGCRRRRKNQMTNIYFSKFPTLPPIMSTTPEPMSTLSSSPMFFTGEQLITQSTQLGPVNGSFQTEEDDDSLAADSLLIVEKETTAVEFLKPFCFWLAVVIGLLAGLAFIIAAVVKASNYIKKRRSQSVQKLSGTMANQLEEISEFPSDFLVVPMSDLFSNTLSNPPKNSLLFV